MSSTEDLAIGIDIGGTNTKFGIVNRNGKVFHRGEIKTRKHAEVAPFIDELYLSILPMIEYAGGPARIRGIGVGAPNGNFYNGTIEYAPNLSWKGVIPLAKMFREKFDMDVILTNDANAAALGEMSYGAARGMRDFIVITLGTGVGSGIVANGHMIYGHDGFAGELGHTMIIPEGRYHPGTGLYGSLESYASATGVARTAVEFLNSRPTVESLLRQYANEEITSKVVFDCARKGDSLSKEVYSYTGKILGMALANFAMATSPEAIILFGGLCNAGDMLFGPVTDSFEKHLLPLFRNKIKILPSELPDDDAAILGASSLVWDKERGGN
ncbi:MAG TPA: ROK family protein [Saprospiraceae bacterium]|jgi:glucokinase|nr:MAG: ROK family protein [Candidatus Parvibacillus calidus]MBX2936908.1 ROK family protein [Saprospiraceae bacterium]MBK7739800.1 ROK family protein [Candidatus Parvibacillus calidus]MBX7179874.1 ROK family protein [Saprospiraceae bacterium]MCB0591904.1 ROK family protein [Saprospiraceae bacterium]